MTCIQGGSMSVTINNTADFARNSGEACFVRLIGANDDYINDIAALDKALSGECAYLRLTSFEKLADRETIARYQSEVERSFAEKPEFSKVLEDYRRSISAVNPTIENNLKVSLMFWYDRYLKTAEASTKRRKLVYSGKLGYREYLLCLLAYYIGFDVLLLLPSGEPAVPPVLLRLSQKCVIGECKNADIPEYRPQLGASGRVPSQPEKRGAFKIPPRPSSNRAKSNANSANRASANAVHSAYKADDDTAKTWAGQNAAAFRIPPHPNRKAAARPAPPAREPEKPAPVRTARRSAPSGRIPPAKPYKQKPELSYEEIAGLAESVVMVASLGVDGKITSSGSGIAISSQGYILTNFHVIEGGGPFIVRTENSDEAFPVTQVIKYHRDFDLAIIRIDRKLRPLGVYSGSSELVRGQKVVAIGSPLGFFNSVSDGIISGFRNVDEVDMIQYTAPTSPGSSGGALLNMHGEVIGICSGGVKEAQNMNFAVSYKQILPFIKPFLSTF